MHLYPSEAKSVISPFHMQLATVVPKARLQLQRHKLLRDQKWERACVEDWI